MGVKQCVRAWAPASEESEEAVELRGDELQQKAPGLGGRQSCGERQQAGQGEHQQLPRSCALPIEQRHSLGVDDA